MKKLIMIFLTMAMVLSLVGIAYAYNPNTEIDMASTGGTNGLAVLRTYVFKGQTLVDSHGTYAKYIGVQNSIQYTSDNGRNVLRTINATFKKAGSQTTMTFSGSGSTAFARKDVSNYTDYTTCDAYVYSSTTQYGTIDQTHIFTISNIVTGP